MVKSIIIHMYYVDSYVNFWLSNWVVLCFKLGYFVNSRLSNRSFKLGYFVNLWLSNWVICKLVSFKLGYFINFWLSNWVIITFEE